MVNKHECLKDYALHIKKEIDKPEALDFENFGVVSNRKATKELKKFWRVKYSNTRGSFVSNAWLKMFAIAEPVIPEYVREFLASVYLDESATTLNQKFLWFQLGGVKQQMTMRQFILTMGLYTEKEVNSREFNKFYGQCWRQRPDNYNPAPILQGYPLRLSITQGDHLPTTRS